MELKTKFIEEIQSYDGAQLQSHWAYKHHDLQGDSLAAFIGPCEVKREQLVDLADAKANAPIYSANMLSFIAEHFNGDLEKAVMRQRLLTCLAQEGINARLGKPALRREGNDLYDGEYKVTVSIATVSPVSAKIHFGVNVVSYGTPVPTKGLEDYKIDPREFGQEILKRYAEEYLDMQMDCCKVRAVP
jgi:uncharacterized protein